MGTIRVVTGSPEGTVLTGQWGAITAQVDSEITVVGSFGEQRFVLPKGNMFTDTGTWLVNDSITSITVWGQGSVVVQSVVTQI